MDLEYLEYGSPLLLVMKNQWAQLSSYEPPENEWEGFRRNAVDRIVKKENSGFEANSFSWRGLQAQERVLSKGWWTSQ